MIEKDFSKCNYCGACKECFETCEDPEECINVCPQGALKKE